MAVDDCPILHLWFLLCLWYIQWFTVVHRLRCRVFHACGCPVLHLRFVLCLWYMQWFTVVHRLCRRVFHACGRLLWEWLSVYVPVSVLEGRDRTWHLRAVRIAVETQRFSHRRWGAEGWVLRLLSGFLQGDLSFPLARVDAHAVASSCLWFRLAL